MSSLKLAAYLDAAKALDLCDAHNLAPGTAPGDLPVERVTAIVRAIGWTSLGKDGETAVLRSPCPRCGGTGQFAHFGTCFRCQGDRFEFQHGSARAEIADFIAKAFGRPTSVERAAARRDAALRRESERRRVALQEAGLSDILPSEEGHCPDLVLEAGTRATDIWWAFGKRRMSEKAVACLRREVDRHKARNDRQAAWKAEADAAPDAPEGRIEVVGEVLAVKSQETAYGVSPKMLVKAEAGWKVWATVPASIRHALDRGARVTFTASLRRSESDPKFAIASRPTQAKLAGA